MMNKSALRIAVILVAACAAGPAWAQCNNCSHGSGYYSHGACCHWHGSDCMVYHENVMWPSRFIPPARRGVYAAMNRMVHNGWRRQNLLGDYHFDKQSGELTTAGKLKVQWILSQAPQNRRNIYVQRGANELHTARRTDSVRLFTSMMSPSVGTVDVNETHLVAEGRPAGTVDATFVGYESNRLPPVLPYEGGSRGGE